MSQVFLAAGLFWSFCLVMSMLSRREYAWLQSSIIHAASVVGFVSLACWVAFSLVPLLHPIPSVMGTALIGIVGVLLGLPYWSLMLGEYIERTQHSLLGVAGMKLEKTYDRAEGLEHEKKYEEALALYIGEINRDREDAEARRRASALCLRLGRTEEALSHLSGARDLCRGEDRVTLSFRLAELSDPVRARKLLEEVMSENRGSKFEKFAAERMKRLTQATDS